MILQKHTPLLQEDMKPKDSRMDLQVAGSLLEEIDSDLEKVGTGLEEMVAQVGSMVAKAPEDVVVEGMGMEHEVDLQVQQDE